MTTKHQVSRLEIYVAWKLKKKKERKKVLKRLSPVLGHSYNTAWIQKLEEFGWKSQLA